MRDSFALNNRPYRSVTLSNQWRSCLNLCQQFLHRRRVQHLFRQQLLQLAVLVLQRLQSLDVRHGHSRSMLRINLPCNACRNTSTSTHRMCLPTSRVCGTDQHTSRQLHVPAKYQLPVRLKILIVSSSVLWLGQTLVQTGGYS